MSFNHLCLSGGKILKKGRFLRGSQVFAAISTSTNDTHSQSSHSEWKSAVSAAEKLVGYPTSYLTLRSLLCDEMSNVATHLRKLMVTTHPLVDTAKQMVYESPQTLQTRGLLVLLVSKAMGQAQGDTLMPHDTPAGVMHSQRSLAEITEMINTAQLIHKGVVNITFENLDPAGGNASDSTSSSPDSGAGSSVDGSASMTTTSINKPLTSVNPDYEFGNKIAILCGDYLLANACKALAALQNSQVVELVSSAIADFTESEFIGYRDEVGRPVPSTGFDLELWRDKTYLAVGSLIAKSCKSTLLLAGHTDQAVLELVFAFSRHLACAWQAQLELQPFLLHATRVNQQDNSAAGGSTEVGSNSGGLRMIASPLEVKSSAIEVTSLPVVLHIQQCCNNSSSSRRTVEFFRRFRELTEEGHGLDQFLLQEVTAGKAGIAGALQVAKEHSEEALRLLQAFPDCEARTALRNMVAALHNTGAQ